jgi:hypothetical protein
VVATGVVTAPVVGEGVVPAAVVAARVVPVAVVAAGVVSSAVVNAAQNVFWSLLHTQRQSSSAVQREPQRVQAPYVWPGARTHCCRSQLPPSEQVPSHTAGGGVGANAVQVALVTLQTHGVSASTSQRKNGSNSA